MNAGTSRHAPHLIRSLRLAGGQRVMVRPACPQDAVAIQAYVRGLSAGSRYNRFLGALSELPPAELDRITHGDRSQLSLIMEAMVKGVRTMIGEARYARVGPVSGEFALSVAEAWRRRGLGGLLLADLERCARNLGVRILVGDVLRSNEAMKALARKAGFAATTLPSDARLVRIRNDFSRPATGLPCGEMMVQARLAAA